MALKTVTLHLPESFYREIAQRAQQGQRTVEEELVAVVTSTLPDIKDLSEELVQALEQLKSLTDEELHQAAGITLPVSAQEEMQTLMFKRQREGLSPLENQEAERLTQRYQHIMLIRAQAAVLLKERGHPTPAPDPLPPI
jgi:hypothetical protein